MAESRPLPAPFSHDASQARAASTSPAGAGATAGWGRWLGGDRAWAAPAARPSATASAAIVRIFELMGIPLLSGGPGPRPPWPQRSTSHGKSMGKGSKTGQESGKNVNFRFTAQPQVLRRETTSVYAKGRK